MDWLRNSLFSVATLAVLTSVLTFIVSLFGTLRGRRRAQRIDEEIKAARERVRPGPTTSSDEVEAVKAAVMESEAAKQGGTRLASQRLERFLTDDSILHEQAESKILEFLPSMPRNAKRLLNHLRLLLVVASERRMLGGMPPLEAAHLGKWIVLLERSAGTRLGGEGRSDPHGSPRTSGDYRR